MKKQEYVSQFGIDVSQPPHTSKEFCIGCEKTAPYLDENEYCNECSEKLKQQSNIVYKSALSDIGNTKKSYFSIIKILKRFIFIILAIILSIFSVCQFAINSINLSVLLESLIFNWTVAVLLSIPCFIYIPSVLKNIKMLKNMKLYNLAQEEAPSKFKTIDGFKLNFAITNNFIYIKSSNLAIPIKFIETLEIEYSRKYGFFLVAVMRSGKKFTIVTSGKFNKNQIMRDYINAMLMKNPTIKLDDPYHKIL